jgi:hypothetical protein
MLRSTAIGAYLAADPDRRTITVVGYGVYAGDDIPPREIPGDIAEAARHAGIPMAFYQLEAGDCVWECECRVVEADRLRERIRYLAASGYSIEQMSVAELRRQSASSDTRDGSLASPGRKDSAS